VVRDDHGRGGYIAAGARPDVAPRYCRFDQARLAGDLPLETWVKSIIQIIKQFMGHGDERSINTV
jgi:hypothetical protein